jgi:hypothetical protein
MNYSNQQFIQISVYLEGICKLVKNFRHNQLIIEAWGPSVATRFLYRALADGRCD